MKKLMTKLLFGVAGTMLLSGGAYLNLLRSAPIERGSDLTLANIEALAFDPSGNDEAIIWGNCYGYDQLCSVTCPQCGSIHYTMNEGFGVISGGYCDNCLHVIYSN